MKTEPPSRAGSLQLLGGDLALDFVNTATGRQTECRIEHLRAYGHVTAWAAHAGAIPAAAAARLDRMAEADPAAAEAALAQVLECREALHAVFLRIAAAGAPIPADLAALEPWAARAQSGLRLVFEGGKPRAAWPEPGQDMLDPLWPVMRAALELLTRGELIRIKSCPGQFCGWIFLDQTKNRSRAWCEMRVCGNRAKQRARQRRNRDLAARAAAL